MRQTPNHNLIEQDCPGATIICVEEFYLPGIGFTSMLPVSGKYCFSNDIYIDDVLKELYKAGATSVNLKMNKKGKIVYIDIQVKSLFA